MDVRAGQGIHGRAIYSGIVSLGKRDYLDALNTMATGGWTGARICDVLLLRCAARHEVERVYTFNLGDFRQLAPDGLQDSARRE